MDLVEKYNTELKGCKFKMSIYDIEYTFGSIVNNKAMVTWIYNGCRYKMYNLDVVFRNLSDGWWVLDKKFIRKKKLEKLINGFKGKI